MVGNLFTRGFARKDVFIVRGADNDVTVGDESMEGVTLAKVKPIREGESPTWADNFAVDKSSDEFDPFSLLVQRSEIFKVLLSAQK